METISDISVLEEITSHPRSVVFNQESQPTNNTNQKKHHQINALLKMRLAIQINDAVMRRNLSEEDGHKLLAEYNIGDREYQQLLRNIEQARKQNKK